jgi:transposase-like protein
MSQLKRAIGDLPLLAVSTDACKGLENAVKVVFRNAEKRECIKHLMQNLVKKFRGKVYSRMWPAARAYERDIFDHHMSKIFAARSTIICYG